jgi:hypothetical protein
MENPKQSPQDRVGDDLLIGATAIAVEMNMSESEIYYARKKRLLPIGKLGSLLIASKHQLRRAARAITETST